MVCGCGGYVNSWLQIYIGLKIGRCVLPAVNTCTPTLETKDVESLSEYNTARVGMHFSTAH